VDIASRNALEGVRSGVRRTRFLLDWIRLYVCWPENLIQENRKGGGGGGYSPVSSNCFCDFSSFRGPFSISRLTHTNFIFRTNPNFYMNHKPIKHYGSNSILNHYTKELDRI